MPKISASNIAEHKALTRESLFDAARSLITAQGYDSISHADITAFAGIARTTFYDYFTSKDDLVAAFVESTLPEVISDLLDEISKDATPPERLTQLSRKTLEFMVSDPFLGLILHREMPKLSADAQQRISAAHSQLGMAFATIYRAGIADGSLRAVPGRLGGRFMEDVIMAAAKELIATPDPEDAFSGIADAMTGLLLGGIGSN